MEFCKKCVMPNTRPGLTLDEEGVCCACRAHEKKILVAWEQRYKELEKLCEKYRGSNGNDYDCIIAVSGGKDSHFQVHIMKEVMGMNPLLVSVEDNFPMTEAGKHNIQNISEEFGCNILSLKPNIKLQKKFMRKTFEKYGMPTWYIDRLIYTFPLKMALKLGIPLIVYGENTSYEYGGLKDNVETYSARQQLSNGAAPDIEWDELMDNEVSLADLKLLEAPSKGEIESLDPIYLSYFLPWNSYKNYIFAKKRGFRDLKGEWERRHHVEDFDQIDSRAYMVHPWMKYPKYGHASATDYASRFVRYGLMSREEAVKLVQERDHDLDDKCVEDFCNFLGYSRTQFWAVINNFYNKDIFFINELGQWELKKKLK